MKESYGEGPASHPDPESCVAGREARGEALAGAHAGKVLSSEISKEQGADPVRIRGRQDGEHRNGETLEGPAESETLSMHGNSMDGNREISRTSYGENQERLGKARANKPSTNVREKSHRPIVPEKRPNKPCEEQGAEAEEERGLTKRNTSETTEPPIQGGECASNGLERVRRAAQRKGGIRFTSLLHHVDLQLLADSYYALKRNAAPGVDGMTWKEYEKDLQTRIGDLHERIHRGNYRALPSRRTYIPKTDGRQRPLGIAALEDKIVQQAIVTVLTPIYEEEFAGFSYGFRPGRSQHDALDALWIGLARKKVNWVLDADIQGFFDNIPHEKLMELLEIRIGDKRVLRLIRKWLRAGVSENGRWTGTTVGTPQGAVISPLLANIFLHYALDTWAHEWRHRKAKGDVIIVRYADDFVVGFQERKEAEQFLEELGSRMEEYGLSLHPTKTRLIEFGRYAAKNRRERGEGKPETFDFLGFTHISGKTRKGRFTIHRRTVKKRMRAKLQAIKTELRKRKHHTISETGRWLRAVVQGYLNYHAIPGNSQTLEAFCTQVRRLWLAELRRRGQKHRMPWSRYAKIANRWIPRPRVIHPYPSVRFYAKHSR